MYTVLNDRIYKSRESTALIHVHKSFQGVLLRNPLKPVLLQVAEASCSHALATLQVSGTEYSRPHRKCCARGMLRQSSNKKDDVRLLDYA